MSDEKHTPWADDAQFGDSIVTAVSSENGRGWSITMADGWSFYVPSDSPVVPEIGMTVRMYGKGIGYIVRGLFLNGECIYYRTEDQQKTHSESLSYGKDAADLLRKWDAGEGVWSIAMGGFGPGYEQAIQIAAFEVLRHLINGEAIENAENAVLPTLRYLGLSGAQWGAAKSLAWAFYQRGPIAVHKEFNDDRHLQVSKDFPSPKAAELLAVVREACAIFDANYETEDEYNSDLASDLWKDEIHRKLTEAIAKAEGRS